MILPPAGDGFEWIDADEGAVLVCRPLCELASHLFTTRAWPPGKAMSGETDAWAGIAAAVGAGTGRILRARQVHGTDAIVHRASESALALQPADVILSDDPRTAIAIQTADCIPLLLADERTGVVAAAHAGWRGTARRVAAAAVTGLSRAFGSRPEDLVAAVGPSIGPCCYEVGVDVRERFAAEGFPDPRLQEWFLAEPQASALNPPMKTVSLKARSGRWFLDLWTATRDQLRDVGLRPDRIFLAGLCTASHDDVFCSYRRDGARAGRLAAAIRAGK